jgi:hypothetical protein
MRRAWTPSEAPTRRRRGDARVRPCSGAAGSGAAGSGDAGGAGLGGSRHGNSTARQRNAAAAATRENPVVPPHRPPSPSPSTWADPGAAWIVSRPSLRRVPVGRPRAPKATATKGRHGRPRWGILRDVRAAIAPERSTAQPGLQIMRAVVRKM